MAKVFNVYIGRFQPAHSAHLQIMEGALASSKYDPEPNLIICVGSAYSPRTPKNPFSLEEREQMIRSAFSAEENKRIHVVGVPDSLYNDTQWAQEVQNAVSRVVDSDSDDNIVRLVGHKKDESSFYLDMFPQWEFVGISNIDNLNSTTIRDYYLNDKWLDEDEDVDVFVEMCQDHLHPNIFAWLLKFRAEERALREDDEESKPTPFEYLTEEFSFIEAYKEQWAHSPYPPTFVTSDAVVIQSGHILLVRRGAAPGKGLWALPGGFVEQDLTALDNTFKELREETKLKVPLPVLKGSVKDKETFDHPQRSLRGRTITHAFLIELNPGPLPKVKGGDDADKARWVPINTALNMEDRLFEDHASIIKYFVGRA